MELRRQLRAWLRAHLTPEVVDAGRRPVAEETLGTLRAWNRRLADAGWAAPGWPVEHGGRAAGLDEQVACYEEMDAAQAPGPINAIGVANIAPAIMAYGSDEQQARFLRPMLRGDEIWSQGMSEPGAGSDLASLRTRAEPDVGGFVVNGQKTWNSLGHLADWCQLYVRTDPDAPKHRGISCLLVDLRSRGIEARPLRTMTGEVSFSELFFSDVRVPTTALLGPLHAGWAVAMTTLSHERAGVARFHLVLRSKLDALLAEAATRGALRDRRTRQRVTRVWSQIACMRWTTERSLAQLRPGPSGRGRGQRVDASGTAGSLAKLAWSRADQALAELATDLLGVGALSGEWAYNLASSRSTSIAGGTTEINRNIVAEQGLGLPRD